MRTAFADAMLAEAQRGAKALMLSFRVSCLSWYEVYAIFGWSEELGTQEQANAVAALEWLLS